MYGWELLNNRDGVEFWKTPTRFLVCRKYEYKFKFFDKLGDAEIFYNSARQEDFEW